MIKAMQKKQNRKEKYEKNIGPYSFKLASQKSSKKVTFE